ncbi:MAG: beta-galactosidase [Anaerolineaceae bacterium]|nr:beta-galactosidase [Anaerolineaceae bacterium]
MIFFGADYYPEHWPEERWLEDARLMAEAGFNIVRLAEFSWSKMEKSEGDYDFSWLDRAINVLSAQNISVILGTPTASPPPWLMVKQEDLFLVEASGTRQTYGFRRENCPNNPLYRLYTERIVSKMADHFKDNPAVIGWQIDNEFGDRCFCEICRSEFQKWLQKRYQTLEKLNEKWGTVFWSHIYTEWSQIPVPLTTIRSVNPSLGLDYRRFMSDTYRGYQKFQIDIIRHHCPGHFVTHNLMGFSYNQLDYYDNSADLDFVSWDNYMRMQWGMEAEIDPARAALSADTMRGLKKKNFWVMEQQSGGGGWELVAVPPKPGEIRLWTYQAIAHGADAIVYFRWRTARVGTEQYWQGILEHHGIPGRRYAEVSQVGKEIKRIADVITGSQVKPWIAIMQSYDTRFAFQVQPNNPRFDYEKHIQDIYRGFYDNNIPMDIVSEKDHLTGYKLVVIPAMYILTDETVANLEKFAADGGIVVFTPRTGVKDKSNTVINMKLPGLVAKMCGIEIEEYISMPVDQDNRIQFGLSELEESFTTTAWADVIDPKGADVIAWHTQDFYAQKPAATINRLKKGKVIYLGVMGESAYYNAIARWLSSMAGVEPLIETPVGVEVAERWQGKKRLVFVLNHLSEVQSITLRSSFLDILSGKRFSGYVPIAPRDVLILTDEEQDEK